MKILFLIFYFFYEKYLDRVHFVAYATMDEHERSKLHLSIGMSLLNACKTQPEQLDNQLFEIVGHLLKASHLLTSQR
jgi:predicted ATPase